jgi:phage internal scaffolding protein
MSLKLRKLNPKPLNQTNQQIHSTYSTKLKISLTFPENSRWTKQSFKQESDINNIMGRYLSSGEIPAINQTAPQYLNSEGSDFQSAMEFVAGAQSMFAEMPSTIRNRFQNDPGQFLDFCSNENNRPEMASMGLLRDEVALAYISPSTGENKPLKTSINQNDGVAPPEPKNSSST